MGRNRNRLKQARMKRQQILAQLSEPDREMLDRLRASLIPNVYGFVASIVRHPANGLWQGWMSDGSSIICISARCDPGQASTDVRAFLEASAHKDFRLEDVPSLQAKFDEGGDAPYKPLPQDLMETLLFYIRILYALEG